MRNATGSINKCSWLYRTLVQMLLLGWSRGWSCCSVPALHWACTCTHPEFQATLLIKLLTPCRIVCGCPDFCTLYIQSVSISTRTWTYIDMLWLDMSCKGTERRIDLLMEYHFVVFNNPRVDADVTSSCDTVAQILLFDTTNYIC